MIGSGPSFAVAANPLPTFDDIMIDIETMSLHPSKALILSVGLLEFDLSGQYLRLGESQMILPSIEQQLVLGRRVDRGTQKFWAEQPREAQAHWLNYAGERSTLARLLHDVRAFVRGKSRVWANGTQFDLSNLVGLAEDIGEEEELWHYRAPRDMRTFVRETTPTREPDPNFAPPFKLVAHEPVSDCISQAMQVWEHWQRR